jgi:hypothetical protein
MNLSPERSGVTPPKSAPHERLRTRRGVAESAIGVPRHLYHPYEHHAVVDDEFR